MTDQYVVAVKPSVFEKTEFTEDDFEEGIVEFDSEAGAEAFVEDLNEERYGTQFVLHTAHPADSSGVDAYLIVKEQGVWTYDG